MGQMAWTKDLELGIKVIDEQHKKIVDYINDLDTAIHSNDKQQVIEVAEQVVNYTVEHFDYEEVLLKKADYLLTEPHITVHNNFKKAAAKMQENILGNDPITAARKMRSDLTIWLMNHIKNEDSDYAAAVGELFNKKSFLNGVFNFFAKK